MRPSGTEPLVRIYAEAETTPEVEELLAVAVKVVTEYALHYPKRYFNADRKA